MADLPVSPGAGPEEPRRASRRPIPRLVAPAALPPLLLALAAGLLAAGSCASGPPDEAAVRGHMFNGMWQMGSIPSRLVMGDVEGTRVSARWLRARLAEEVMPGQEDAKERMIGLAGEVERATTVADAAGAVAELAATCGECHQRVEGGPSFRNLGSLPVGSRLPTHMLRHVWAADRLWEGLLAVDPGPWDAGAAVLGEEPLPFFERLEDELPDVARYARRLHALGDEAMAARERGTRARVYAELLTTCAGCHAVMEIPRR